MSPINNFGILAFASAALAVPFGHEHLHHHHHEARAPQGTYGESSAAADGSPSSAAVPSYPVSSFPSGSASFSAYGTGWGHGTGTGYGTGWGSGVAKPTGWYPSVSVSAAASCTASTTTCIWRSTTSVSTIYFSSSQAAASYVASSSVQAAASGGAGGWGAASGGAAACTPDTTVTEKVTATVTVTAEGTSPASVAAQSGGAGGWGASTGAPSYSSVAAASGSGAAPSYPAGSSAGAASGGAGGWGASTGATSYSSAAAASGSGAAPSYPAGSSAAPTLASYAPAGASASAQAYDVQPTGRTSDASSGASSFSGGKRGLAYNDASLVTPFIGQPNIGFAYNWVSNPAGLAGGIPFIPELHDTSSEFTSVWQSDAQNAIDNGAEYLFGFNEPDIPSQANLSPQAAADAWRQYIEPFANQAKLVAPAVSNSGSPGQGLDWLQQFMDACSDCTISAVNQHWYDYTSNDLSLFQQQISQAASQSGLPVFVGEFGFIGSDSDISSALSQAMDWMDGQDSVLGYAYYFLESGFLLDGSTPSAYGAEYLS